MLIQDLIALGFTSDAIGAVFHVKSFESYKPP